MNGDDGREGTQSSDGRDFEIGIIFVWFAFERNLCA